MALGVRDAGFEAVEVPVADGGDGTLDVLLACTPGSRVEVVAVTGPLGAGVDARLGWLRPGEAVVEMAEAAGLRLVPPALRDPLGASTYGVGELIRAALDGGARRIVVGVGGSATTDGGAGALAALGVRFLDALGGELPLGGGALRELASVEVSGLDARLRDCRVEVAVDVRSPLLGPHGSASVFAPQKGATPEQVEMLEAGLLTLVAILDETLPEPPEEGVAAAEPGAEAPNIAGTGATAELASTAAAPPGGAASRSAEPPSTVGGGGAAGSASEVAELPGSGAAGGCAFGLAAVAGARLVPGAALVCDLVGLDRALDGAALVLTGEGRLDPSTAAGKAPAEVARRAAARGIPCVAIAGTVAQPADSAYAEALPIGDALPLDEAMARTAELLRSAARGVAERRLRPR